MLEAIVACALAGAQDSTALRINDGATPAATVPAGAALAEGAPPILGVAERTRVTADVGAWVARLTGTTSVGAAGTSFNLNEDLAVEDQTVGAAGEFAVWCDRWRFGGVGLIIGLNETQTAPKAGVYGTTAIAIGDTIRGDYNLWMAGAEVGYVVWRPFADEPWPWSAPSANRELATKAMGHNGRPLFDLRLLVLAGGLGMGYDQTLQNVSTGSSSEFSTTVGAIYGGGGAEFDLGMDDRIPVLQDIRIYAYAGLGPTIPDGDAVWMVRVGLAAMVTPNIGVEFGYRLFDFNLTDGPSEVDGGVRGIFGAVAVKF
ncbi:MAG: hypothetical protein JNK53_05015 [Phycisphaerae bacterium]|nr:hypothetical protein [Phycisphaerae bacterium]